MKEIDFFVNEDLKEFKIHGKVFKYKPVNAGDELDWVEDYLDEVEVVIPGETPKIIKKQNDGKLSICKLRNIIEVPFSQELCKKMTKLDKPYSDYNNQDKDLLFRKVHPTIYNLLIVEVDKIKNSKKG